MAAQFAIDIVVRARDQASGTVARIVGQATRAQRQGAQAAGRRGGNIPSVTETAAAVNQIAGVSKALVGTPIELASEFEAAVNTVNALSGGTFGLGGQLDSIAAKARELGAATEFTAKQSAEAFAVLTQAGLSYEQQMTTVATVLDFATVGQVSMAKSADLLTAAMGGFGLEGPDAAKRVGDTMARVANSTQANISDVGATFRKAAPLAKTLGVEIENVGIAVAVLGKGAIRGGEAGTALKSIFASLATVKTDSAKAALKAMGLTKKDLVKAMESGDLKNVFALFADSFAKKGIEGTSRVAVLEALVGKHHFVKLDQLIQSLEAPAGATGSWDVLSGKVQDTSITLNKSAEIMRSGTRAEGIKLQSALEELGITIGEKLLPILTPLIVDAQHMAITIARWADAHPALVSNIGKMLLALAGVGTVVGPLLVTFLSFKTLVNLSGVSVFGLGQKATVAAPAVGRLGTALSLLGPLAAGITIGIFLDQLRTAEAKMARMRSQIDQATGGGKVGSKIAGQMNAEEKAIYTEGKARYIEASNELAKIQNSHMGLGALRLGDISYQQGQIAHAQALMKNAELQARARMGGGAETAADSGYEYTSEFASEGDKATIAAFQEINRKTLEGAQQMASVGKSGKDLGKGKIVVEVKAPGLEARVTQMESTDEMDLEVGAGVNPEGY